jgi:uncharacterized membrane protein YccC
MQHLVFDKDRFTHSIKTALACLIGFIITKSTHLPVDQWLIITILVVMCAQVNVGSMIQKSYMRFLGTLTGSLVAAATLLMVGVSPIVTGFVITLSALFFSYLASSQTSTSEAGTLGAVTVTIILISHNPTIETAIGRFLEITAGIMIAALVSQFIMPIHARNLLRRRQVQTIQQLRAYYLATILSDHSTHTTFNYHEIDDEIIKSLIAQRKLATEAAREPFAKKSNVVMQFQNLLRYEREIQRSITFMHHAYKCSPETKKLFSSMDLLRDFHDKVCFALEKISTRIGKKSDKNLEIEPISVQPIKSAIRTANNYLSEDDITYTNAFLFCAEILVERINDIAALIKK